MSYSQFLVNVAKAGLAKSDLRVTGSSIAGSLITAAYAKGSGTVMFTRTPTVGGASQDIGSAVASGSTYTVLITDRGYTIGARPITYLPPPAVGIAVPAVAPLAPTINSVAIGNGLVTATFTRNADSGGDTVTGDRLYVYLASDDSLVKYVDGVSPITVTGLTNDVAVYVRAATIGALQGVGPQSVKSANVTPLNVYYASFSYEVRSATSSGAVRPAVLNSRRQSLIVANPSSNLQTMEYALTTNPNNNRNAPSTGWTAITPGNQDTLTGADAQKQLFVRVASASTKAATAAVAGGTTSATFTVPGHGITVGATAIRGFEGFTPAGLNIQNVTVTATDANTLTCTLLAATADATVLGYMFNSSECAVITTAENP